MGASETEPPETPETPETPEPLPVRVTGRLEDWSVADLPSVEDNPYLPPEQRVKILCGRVHDNPAFDAGFRIKTSRIVAANGRFVVTASGSVYRLGAVAPAYREWLAAEGYAWDEAQPVTVVTIPDPDFSGLPDPPA